MSARQTASASFTATLPGTASAARNNVRHIHQKNRTPCTGCSSRKIRCVYIRHPGMGQVPLCQACEKRGYQQCSPHIRRARREEVGPASAANVPSFDPSGTVNPIAALNIQSGACLANFPTAMDTQYTTSGWIFSAQDDTRWQFAPDQLTLEAQRTGPVLRLKLS